MQGRRLTFRVRYSKIKQEGQGSKKFKKYIEIGSHLNALLCKLSQLAPFDVNKAQTTGVNLHG